MKSKYKAIFIKSFISVVAICTMVLVQSCSESISEINDEQDFQTGLESKQSLMPEEYTFINNKYKVPEGLTKWEAQLNRMIDNNQLLMKNGLKLVNYEYERKVLNLNDLETIKSELNNDHNFFLIYSDDGVIDFTIGKDEAVSKKYKKFLDLLFPTSGNANGATSSLSSSVYIFEENDLGMVGLTWEYKGKKLNTTCLVSKRKGIIYDKLLSFIPFEIKQYTEITSGNFLKSPLKSYIDSTDNDRPLSKGDNYNNRRLGLNGKVLFSYNITAILNGQRVAGINYATSPEVRCEYFGLDSSDPWSYFYGTWDCKADVRILDFKEGPGGYMRYAYAWAYQHNGVVNLSWNGFGYNVTGGGTGASGEKTISIND